MPPGEPLSPGAGKTTWAQAHPAKVTRRQARAREVEKVRNYLSSFFSGIGRTRIVMVGAVTAMVVNAGVNYTLIFGK